MLSIAHILISMGHKVYGTDTVGEFNGSIINIKETDNIPLDVQIVVYNTDIQNNHHHMIQARERNLSIVHRSTILEWITKDRLKLSVTGGSGKTSTTFYLYQLLNFLNKDPFVFMGERTFKNDLSYSEGKGPYVVEINEADFKFHNQTSDWLIVTNYGVDHIWLYKNNDNNLNEEEDWQTYWQEMIDRSKYLIFFHDDENLRKFYENRKDPHIKIGFSYGMNGGDLKIKEIHESLNNIKFSFMLENIEYNGEINLHGSFNVLNVCATILLIHKAFNISVEEILIHLPKLKHSKRRMEIIYEDTERIIFDDQALTPKEISVVLSSVKKYKKPIYILLDPFRDIRVNYFFNEFCEVIKPYIFASTYEQFWHLPNCIPIKTNDDFKEFLNNKGVICLLYKGFKWKPLVNEKFNNYI